MKIRKYCCRWSIGALAFATPASAATGKITVNNGACYYYASQSGGTVTATNKNCDYVAADVQYITAAGSTHWIYGENSTTQSVTSTPSGVSYVNGRTEAFISGAWNWQNIS